MDPNKLPPSIREHFIKCETQLRNKYIDLLKTLTLEELNAFDKSTYKALVVHDFMELMPDCKRSDIETSAHYISNALNNAVSEQRGLRRLGIRSTVQGPIKSAISTGSMIRDLSNRKVNSTDVQARILQADVSCAQSTDPESHSSVEFTPLNDISDPSSVHTVYTGTETELECGLPDANEEASLLDTTSDLLDHNESLFQTVETNLLIRNHDEENTNLKSAYADDETLLEPEDTDRGNTNRSNNARKTVTRRHSNRLAKKKNQGVKAKVKPKASRKSTDRNKCHDKCSAANAKERTDQIQCNFCQSWFHEKCMNVQKEDILSFWLCLGCRLFPKTLADINTRLDQLAEVNEDLVRQLSTKLITIQELQSENARLRDNGSVQTHADHSDTDMRAEAELSGAQERHDFIEIPDLDMSSSENESTPVRHDTLLTGDSIIRDITQSGFALDTEPICVRGGKVSDITARLLELSNESERSKLYNKIILHCGSNNAVQEDFQVSVFKEDYEILVTTASELCNSVVISGICPRLDDISGNICKANECLKILSEEMSCKFVENDNSFRNSNKTVNVKLLCKDNIHINMQGSKILAKNLGVNLRDNKRKPDSLGNENQYNSTRNVNNKTQQKTDNRYSTRNVDKKTQQKTDSQQKSVETDTRTYNTSQHKGNGSYTRNNQSYKRDKRQDNRFHNTDRYNVNKRHYNDIDTRQRNPYKRDNIHDTTSYERNRYNENKRRHDTEPDERYDNYYRHKCSNDNYNEWHTVSHRRRRRPSKTDDHGNNVRCWFCGESNHTTSVCRHGKEIICKNCDGRGHKAKFCPHEQAY